MSEYDQSVQETEGVKITDKRKLDPETGAPRSENDQAPVLDEATSAAPADPVAELTADLQRLQAEYSNYRKRVERDREVTRELTISGTLAEFLPIIDDIGRARAHGELEGAFKSVGEALESTVQRLGLKPFGQPGDEFDPTRHEALTMETGTGVESGVIIEVIQKGYMIGERVIRAALVRVAQ